MGLLSFLFGSKGKADCRQLIKDGAVIIDVRTPNEFAEGHAKKSINIPLYNIHASLEEITHYNKPVILVCRSGARAGQARELLKKAGMEVYNAGSWKNVDY